MSKYKIAVCFVLCSVMALGTVALGQSENVELTIWHHWGGSRLDMMDRLIADFEAQYPWITVQHTYTSTAGAADRMGTLLLSGAAPEIMMVRGTYAFQFMSHGGFLRLDDLLQRDDVALDMFNEADLATFQLLGTTYALPAMSGAAWTNLMFYNKDIMNNAGLDPNRPPETWTEWRDMSRRMTREDESGQLLQAGTTIPLLSSVAAWNGANFWTDDWRQAAVENPRTAETIEFVNDLIDDTYGSYGASTSFVRDMEAAWAGQIGLFFTNNSGFALVQDVEFEWGAAVAPVNAIHPGARPTGIVSSTWAYGIPADIPEHKLEAAWLLLQWLTTNEEGGGWFSRVQGRPSPVIDFNRHADYRFENPYWNVVIEALQYDVAAPPVNALVVIDQAGRDSFRGVKHPQQAMADADREIQLLLDRYWETVAR